jgi:hypothetical protein
MLPKKQEFRNVQKVWKNMGKMWIKQKAMPA